MSYRQIIIFFAAVIMGCSDQPGTTPTGSAGAPVGTTGEVQVASGNEGKVVSVEQAGAYTYIEIERQPNNVWLASSRVDVSAGETVAWYDAAVMKDFTSKTLNRTFPEILFVARVDRAGAGAPSLQGAAANNPAGAMTGEVLQLMEGGGYSYIEVAVDGQRKWLAAPLTRLSQGERISWQGGSLMRQFSSKTLDRTFDEILFVAAVSKAD